MRVIFGFFISMIAGCAQLIPSEPDRLDHAKDIAQAGQMQMLRIDSENFGLTAFVRQDVSAQANARRILTVYLEGDGHAWCNRFTPSNTPTPIEPIALKLAAQDPRPDVAYLARPCQYLANKDQGRLCSKELWTSQRYSKQIILATNQALDQLKALYQAKQLILIGYSGGGAVALLVATQRRDVMQIITVAGNLDTQAWASMQGLDPLSGSLNPADDAVALASIPQIHFIGAHDMVMPKAVADSYLNRVQVGRRDRAVILIRPHSHACCWSEDWPALIDLIEGPQGVLR